MCHHMDPEIDMLPLASSVSCADMVHLLDILHINQGRVPDRRADNWRLSQSHSKKLFDTGPPRGI